METVEAHRLGRLLDAELRRRSGLTEAEWRQVCASGKIPGSKHLAVQSGVSLRSVGRALRACPGDGLRMRLDHADQLLMACGYGPETLHELYDDHLPGWAYGLSEDCLHVDPAWGI